MAKKKPTNVSKNQDKPPQNLEHQQHTAMDDSSEKFENLKSLNSMLLKETLERRQQVESLLHSKGSLESALTRSEMENRALLSELTQLQDRTAQLELESDLVLGFVDVQVSQQAGAVEKERSGFLREKVEIEKTLKGLEREMKEVMREKSEIEKVRSEKESEIELLGERLREHRVEIDNERSVSILVCRERDDLRLELGVKIEETNGLRKKIIELENREKEIEEEVWKLRKEYIGAMVEKEEMERRIESMMREKNGIEKCLAESNRVIEGLRREVREIMSEKEGVEEERDVEVMKKNDLEIAVAKLNEMVVGLQKEEVRLRGVFADLEKRFVKGVEKEKKMLKEIVALFEEKTERERLCEKLVEEKGLVKSDLDVALGEIGVQKEKMDELVRKKIEIEEQKVSREIEIVEMKRMVSGLREAVSVLESSFREQTEKNGQLQSEVSHYRDTINKVSVERDEARKGMDEEKKNAVSLRERILEMEKDIEETKNVINEMKAENQNVFGEKKEIESRCTRLMEEIALLEDTNLKARKEVEEIQAKVESANANSELVLNMLRNTAAIVCPSQDENGIKEDGGFIDEERVGESVKPYVARLEEIKNAFKNREIKVGDMERQLEFLQISVAEAHKRKGFWALVSSATTVFAAFTVAYATRGR